MRSSHTRGLADSHSEVNIIHWVTSKYRWLLAVLRHQWVTPLRTQEAPFPRRAWASISTRACRPQRPWYQTKKPRTSKSPSTSWLSFPGKKLKSKISPHVTGLLSLICSSIMRKHYLKSMRHFSHPGRTRALMTLLRGISNLVHRGKR